jgi:hypothetical protein
MMNIAIGALIPICGHRLLFLQDVLSVASRPCL